MAMAMATWPSATRTVPQCKQEATLCQSAVGIAASSSPHRFNSLGIQKRNCKQRVLNAVAMATPSSSVQQKTQYHFLVANAKFMLDEEEHLQELLKERLRNYGEKNKEQDFWIVIEPKFLQDFPDITKRLSRPAVALISTDRVWITFMKLRIDRVLKGVYESDNFADAVASNPIDLSFGSPQNWTAPYPKYESGWWTPFLPSTNESS